MTWILEFLDVASLIQTSESTAVLLTTVDNMSSNMTWYFGEIEPVNKFGTNPTCVECILLKAILNHFWLLGAHLGIFTPGLYNFGSKTYAGKPQTWQLIKFSETWSNFNLDHISIEYYPDYMSCILLYIHIACSNVVEQILVENVS